MTEESLDVVAEESLDVVTQIALDVITQESLDNRHLYVPRSCFPYHKKVTLKYVRLSISSSRVCGNRVCTTVLKIRLY